MSKSILTVIFCFFILSAWSQDKIIYQNGNNLSVKILKVGEERIVYALKPDYVRKQSVRINQIKRIEFHDGRVQSFEKASSTKSPTKIARSKNQSVSIFNLSLHGGLNTATGLYDYQLSPTPPTFSILLAPSLGIGMDLRISKAFSVESSLAYRGKGNRINMKKWVKSFDPIPSENGTEVATPEGKGFISTYAGYGEFGLCPVIHLSSISRIGIGAYASIGIHGKEKSDYTIEYSIDGQIQDKQEVDRIRQIKFYTSIAPESDADNKSFNYFDYGYTLFLDFGKKPLTYRFTLNWGQKTWEPDTERIDSEDLLDTTSHLTGMFSIHYWFL